MTKHFTQLIVDASAKGQAMLLDENGSEDGRLVADRLRPADAHVIAQRVNAHDALVEALRACLDSMERIGSRFPVLDHDEAWDAVVDAAHEALVAAGAEEAPSTAD